MTNDNGKTAVSVVPLPLERDSRSLKIAASLARFGWRSLAVESLPSSRPELLPVPTVTLGRQCGIASAHGAAPGATARHRLPRWLKDVVHLGMFLAGYFVLRPVQGLRQVPRADLYYLHEYRLFPTLWLLRLLGRGAPIIYDAHDLYTEVWAKDSLSLVWRRLFLPAIAGMERLCVRRAAAVVTVSDGVAAAIERRHGVRPLVIRNCHDRRLDRAPPRSLRDAAGVGERDFLVAVIGNHKAGQALEPLIAALTSLPAHVHVAFIGRFYEPAIDIARRHGVAARVHTVGAVAPEEVVPFASGAALLSGNRKHPAYLPQRFLPIGGRRPAAALSAASRPAGHRRGAPSRPRHRSTRSSVHTGCRNARVRRCRFRRSCPPGARRTSSPYQLI